MCFLTLSSDNPTAPLAQAHEIDDGIPSTQTVGGDSVPANKWQGQDVSAQAYAYATANASARGATVVVSPSVDVDEVVFLPGLQTPGNEVSWQGEVDLVAHRKTKTNQRVLIVVQRYKHRVHGWISVAGGTILGFVGTAAGATGGAAGGAAATAPAGGWGAIPGGIAGGIGGGAAGTTLGYFGGEAVRWFLGFGIEIRNKVITDEKAELTDWDWSIAAKLASADGNFAGLSIHVTDEWHNHPSSSYYPNSNFQPPPYVPGQLEPAD